MSKRTYRKQSEWKQLVEEYDTNYHTESKSSYCRQKGISATTFCKWHKYFRETSSFIKLPKASSLRKKPQTGYLKLFGLKLIKFELHV